MPKKSKRLPAPEWLPDWENPKAYPDPKTATMQQWAWEFMRRNSEYLKDCESIKIFSEKDNIIIPVSDDINDEKSCFIVNPQKLCDLLTKYDLCHLCHPSTPFDRLPDNPPLFAYCSFPAFDFFNEEKHNIRLGKNMDSIDSFKKMYYSECHPPLLPTNQAEIVVKFCLDIPLKQQVDLVKEILNKQAKKQCPKGDRSKPAKWRNRVELYRDYLRLLDGEAQGISQAKMAAIIYPTNDEREKLVQKNLKSAKEIRDIRCRMLAHQLND
jgi:hypothetical protein